MFRESSSVGLEHPDLLSGGSRIERVLKYWESELVNLDKCLGSLAQLV
jgi:hypothetical protein